MSSDFSVDVAENWQSEFLQFTLYIFATVWLVQRGSSESKELDKAGPESDEDQMVGDHAEPDSPAWARAGGLRQVLYSRSLGITRGSIFVLAWLAQSIAGLAAFNGQQVLAVYCDSEDRPNRNRLGPPTCTTGREG